MENLSMSWQVYYCQPLDSFVAFSTFGICPVAGCTISQALTFGSGGPWPRLVLLRFPTPRFAAGVLSIPTTVSNSKANVKGGKFKMTCYPNS